jgi:hypothetical protein
MLAVYRRSQIFYQHALEGSADRNPGIRRGVFPGSRSPDFPGQIGKNGKISEFTFRNQIIRIANILSRIQAREMRPFSGWIIFKW